MAAGSVLPTRTVPPSPEEILDLQRLIGNRAVQRLLTECRAVQRVSAAAKQGTYKNRFDAIKLKYDQVFGSGTSPAVKPRSWNQINGQVDNERSKDAGTAPWTPDKELNRLEELVDAEIAKATPVTPVSSPVSAVTLSSPSPSSSSSPWSATPSVPSQSSSASVAVTSPSPPKLKQKKKFTKLDITNLPPSTPKSWSQMVTAPKPSFTSATAYIQQPIPEHGTTTNPKIKDWLAQSKRPDNVLACEMSSYTKITDETVYFDLTVTEVRRESGGDQIYIYHTKFAAEVHYHPSATTQQNYLHVKAKSGGSPLNVVEPKHWLISRAKLNEGRTAWASTANRTPGHQAF